MATLIPLALTIAPELAGPLFGAEGAKAAAAVATAIQEATGTTDPDAASTVLGQNPAASAQLRMDLARLAAEQDQATRAAELEQWTATVRDAAGKDPASGPSGQKAALAWSAPAISAVVLLTFGIVMGMVLTHGMPAGAETAINLLLGTLAAMATSVVSYWVGSSAGSARKDDRLAQAGK